jgi:hypothetical protein
VTNSTRTIVFTGPGFELSMSGLPDPDSPIHYYDKKGERIDVTLKAVRGKITTLLDNGWAVLTSNRSGASYGVYLGRLRK